MTQKHSDYYASNVAYTRLLKEHPLTHYQKYIRFLKRDVTVSGKILDVGCGVGQVVNKLCSENIAGYGVDVSYSSLREARQNGKGHFMIFNGSEIPFDDGRFDIVGAYNVLEHVEKPLDMLSDMVRVLKPGGTIVVAAPNFLAISNSYHWHTAGIVNKVRNVGLLFGKATRFYLGGIVAFHYMEPRLSNNMKLDDDAIIVTNPVDIIGSLKGLGIRITHFSSASAEFQDGGYVAALRKLLHNAPVIKYLMGAAFIVGHK